MESRSRQRSIGNVDCDEKQPALGRYASDLAASVEPGGLMRPVSFDALLDSAPNPNAATVREAVTAALNESDQVRFLTELRRAFDEDRAVRRMAGAYVSARTD